MQEMIMSSQQIQRACARIGAQLDARLSKQERLPVFICVMKGAINFMVDLMEHVHSDLITDYVRLSSYEGLGSTGEVVLKQDVSHQLKGRTVVVVEDVVDSGLSMHFLLEHLRNKYQPKEIIVCCLIDKQGKRKMDVKVDYCGMVLKEDKFLVGYGLDYKGLLRNVPYVYVPTQEEVASWERAISKEEQAKKSLL